MRQTRRPYLLPRNLVIDPERIQAGVTFEILKKYIEKHENRLPRYQYLAKLYEGFHDIFNKPELPSWKPDDRLAVNFPRELTETFTGFFNGIPIKETSPDELVNESICRFSKANELDDHESELIKTVCQKGHAYEFLYQDEQGHTKMTVVDPEGLFVVYDNTVKNRALFAVRYGYREAETGLKRLYGEILERSLITPFNSKGLLEPYENPYGYIPVIEYKLNEERIGLYEPAAGMIESYNYALSEKSNDVASFAEAYLAILGARVDEEGVTRIRDDRVINLYGTSDAKEILVQFLQKPSADGTQENLLNRLERLIYKICMVPNITEETFGSSPSGISLAYKLKSISDLAKTVERKFSKSLRKRYKIFCSLSTNAPNPDAYLDMEFTFTRNYPEEILSIKEQVDAARNAEGIISHETQLQILSKIVQDVQAELEKIAKEEEDVAKISRDLSEL